MRKPASSMKLRLRLHTLSLAVLNPEAEIETDYGHLDKWKYGIRCLNKLVSAALSGITKIGGCGPEVRFYLDWQGLEVQKGRPGSIRVDYPRSAVSRAAGFFQRALVCRNAGQIVAATKIAGGTKPEAGGAVVAAFVQLHSVASNSDRYKGACPPTSFPFRHLTCARWPPQP